MVLVRFQDIDCGGLRPGVGLVAQQAMGRLIPNLARGNERWTRGRDSPFHRWLDHVHLLDNDPVGRHEDRITVWGPVVMPPRVLGRAGRADPSGAVRVTEPSWATILTWTFIFPAEWGLPLGGGLRYQRGG